MDPAGVAPMVGWLCHESCTVTGEMAHSAAGRVARAFPAESSGVYRQNWTIEDIAANIDAIRSTETRWSFRWSRRAISTIFATSF